MRQAVMAAAIALLWSGTASAQTEPYPDAPMCPSHDDRAYHTLWDAERGCHYDHHHGSDPHELDDIFGAELFDLMGGEISHPWQTFSENVGTENELKHAGYFWMTGRDLDCPNPQCIVDYRVLIHQHTVLDAAVRFHSYVFEARTYDSETGEHGYVRSQGWTDTGHLLVDGVRVIDVGQDAEPGRHKQHRSIIGQIIWYSATRATHEPDARGRLPRTLSISTSVHDTWVPTTVDGEPGEFICYPNERCPANSTLTRAHLLTVHGDFAEHSRDIVDPDGDGIVDWRGYADRYGVPQPEGVCSEPGLDCSPVVFENIRVDGTYLCRESCEQRYVEHDVFFDGRTANWNEPVNSSNIPGGEPEPEPEPDTCPDGSEGRPVTIEDADGRTLAMLWECHLE